MASSISAPPPLVDEEMVTRIQQQDKIHSFLEGIDLRPMARRKAAQALTRVMARNHYVVVVDGSLMQVAYQEAKDSVTFSNKDLVNRVVDGDRPLYVTTFLGASRIKRASVDTGASTNILPLPTFDALQGKNYSEATTGSRNRSLTADYSWVRVFGSYGWTNSSAHSFACNGREYVLPHHLSSFMVEGI